MKIKLFVAREIQYFEFGIFSCNSYVHYLTRGFIASTRAFNLPTRAFSVLTREFELITRGSELVTHGFELVTRVLLFHYKTMLSYCLKCRKNTESKNPKVARTKKARAILLSKFAVCNSKISSKNYQRERS